MLGFDAPLTIETKDVLGCPKGGRATMRNVSEIAIASALRVEGEIEHIFDILFITFYFRTFYLVIPFVAFRIN
jgi:hypothetical protein